VSKSRPYYTQRTKTTVTAPQPYTETTMFSHVSGLVSEICSDIGRKSRIFHTHRSRWAWFSSEFRDDVVPRKQELWRYRPRLIMYIL